MTRRLALIAALVGAVAASLAPALVPVASAALPDLSMTSQTRYEVDPDHQAVHVTVSLTAVNHRRDTKTRLYYFDQAYLAVQPGTTNFKITARTGGPTVRVADAKADHNLLRIDFGKRLPAGSSRTFTLTFDIPDPGGAATREVRIGSSLVTFSAWAFASESTPGGSVEVVFPAGYNIEVQSQDLPDPTKDAAGRSVYSSGQLAEPLTFFAYFIADRPSAYMESAFQVRVGGRPLEVTLRAWPDDPAWAERISGLLESGLPALGDSIGLPWQGEEPLVVAEAISQSSAGYSGRYDPTTGRIEIAYYAGSLVALHEAAHAWFDGSLLADRWATEGFASWYALQAATAIGEKVAAEPLTPDLMAARIPLNAWAPVGANTSDAEDYGYAASAQLAALIAERAGPNGLQSVWQAARDGFGAYQPPGLERGSGPPDWRGLLDLLEDRTGQTYDDLWRAWVVRHDESALLDARAEARRRYEALVTRAGDWQLPEIVRQAMRAWQFEQATELMTAANAALDDRDAVGVKAAAAGLTMPGTLAAAFEGGRGFAAAAAEADAELAAIDAYVRARDARLGDPDLIEQVGMWGKTPATDLTQAAAAFSAGDLSGSAKASTSARIAWEGARELGRNRVMSILAAALAALIGVGVVVSTLRGIARRRSRARRLMAHRRQVRAAGDAAGSPGGGRP